MNSRIKKVQQKLSTWNVDALWVSCTIDLYYLLEEKMSRGFLLITKDQSFLIVDGRYIERMKQKFGTFVLLESETKFDALLPSCQKLGFDSEKETFAAAKKLEEKFPKQKLVPLSRPIERIRIIKEPSEIKKIRKACTACQEGFLWLKGQLKPGVSEEELARELEIYWKRKGCDHLAFESIIAFGKNSAFPHHRTGKSTLLDGDVVLIDIGVVIDSYNSDMTRTILFKNADTKLQEIYAIVAEAQERAFQACKAGITTTALDAVARNYIEEKGFGAYFGHGLGHGVGLEVHEMPYLRKKKEAEECVLEENMVVTLEPGIYVPGLGGVRIEDTVLVGKDHSERLITV